MIIQISKTGHQTDMPASECHNPHDLDSSPAQSQTHQLWLAEDDEDGDSTVTVTVSTTTIFPSGSCFSQILSWLPLAATVVVRLMEPLDMPWPSLFSMV